MNQNESYIQQQCVKWFRLAYARYSWLLFSIPNEGIRTKLNANRMKAQGLVSGVADLFLSVPRGEYHGMYIEMKSGKGRQSENQKIFESKVIAQNYRYVVCYSFDDFSKVVNDYLVNY